MKSNPIKSFVQRLRTKINFCLNESGFGIIETIVAASIIGILCIGMGTVAINMSKTQAQSNLYSTLSTISNNMQRTILDSNAWLNTVNAAANGANFTCLATNAPCTQTVGYPAAFGTELTAYTAFNAIYDGSPAGGAAFYTDTGTLGYKYDGNTCNTFVANLALPGDDQCPISYRLRYAFYCTTSPSPCVQPSVLIFGILQYHPGSWGEGMVVNTARYSVNVSRVAGAYNRNDSIRIEDTTLLNLPPLTAGLCNGAVDRIWAAVPILDTANNVVSIAGGVVTLKPGGYTCNAVAAGYGVDGFAVSFLVNGAVVATSPPAFAHSAAPGRIHQVRITEFSLNETANFTVELQQKCQSNGAAYVPHVFGIPVNIPNTPNIFAGIYCTRNY